MGMRCSNPCNMAPSGTATLRTHSPPVGATNERTAAMAVITNMVSTTSITLCRTTLFAAIAVCLRLPRADPALGKITKNAAMSGIYC